MMAGQVGDRHCGQESQARDLRGQLDGTAAGLEQITGLLNTLIAQQGDQPGGTS